MDAGDAVRNPLSDKIVSIPPSGIRKFFDIVSEMPDAISLGVGEPDFDTPWHIREEGIYSLEKGRTFYTSNSGLKELREEIVRYLERRIHVSYDPLREVLITVGGSEGIDAAFRAMLNPGDEVLIPAPSYPNNFLNVKIMGGVPVPVPLQAERGFQFCREDFESRITEKTKAVVLTHPNNPTTTVFNRQSLEILRQVVLVHYLVLICDQAFEDFCYENEMITPAALPDMFQRTVTVFSFSKGMGLSGLRVGYLVCSDEIMDTMYANAVSVLGATNTACQKAVEAALDNPGFMEEFRTAFDKRRHLAVEILGSVPGVSVELPESGFLCWVDVSTLGSAGEVAAWLLKEARVSVNAGDNYGPGGEGHLRIVLGVYRDTEKVRQALLRIREALLTFPGRFRK